MSIPQVLIPTKIKSMPKYVLTSIVALLLLGAIGTYMILNPNVPATPIPTAKVRWGTIYPYLSLTGQIGNHQTVDVTSSTGGQIVRWLVHEGSVVKANAPLAYFSDYQLNKQIYDNQEAGLEDLISIENDQSQLGNLDHISAASQSTIIQDKAAVNQARTQYLSAKRMVKDAHSQYNLAKVVSPSQKQSLQQNVDQTSNTVTVDEALLNQANIKLQTDQNVINDAANIKADQQAVSVAQQQLNAAQSIASTTQSQLTAVTQGNIQAAKSALDQAESQVSIDQALLNQAQTKLTSDEQPQATSSTTQQDQANISLLQTQLSGAEAQLATDQSEKASPSVLQADQNSISDLEQQISAAKNQLSTDQSQPEPAYVIQEDNAAIQVAQQQLDAAQTVESDDQTVYDQAQSSTNQASVAAVQTALAQANGNVQVDQALLAQAQTKLTADQTSSQPADQLQQDQAAIEVAQQQLNAAQVLLQDAKTAQKINSKPAQSQVVTAKINYDQAVGTEKVDQAALNMAIAKLHIDESPLDQRGMLAQVQSEWQAKQSVDQARMNVLNAKENLIQSEILAPVDGIVVSINAPAGARIYSAQSAVTLYPTKQHQQIVALADASQVDQIKDHDRVTFNSPDFSGSGKGIVEFISPVPNNQSQGNTYQYPIYIDVTKVPQGTTTGMLVNMNVYTSPISHVKIVPSGAVFTKNGNMGVYVKTGTNQFQFKTVHILSSDSNNVQVGGLKPGTVISLKQP